MCGQIDIFNLRIGHGHDVHALFPGKELWLGGVLIPEAAAGFDTHSDGDVLSHAVVDALAGAISVGDRGTHFPENDAAAQDARSLEFVSRFMVTVRKARYEMVNVDSFVTLGTTRLRPHVAAMATNLAGALGVARDVVSVKARSHDGLGLEGRGEAASATATVLLAKRV
ncbi:MAG: 2-C-methyl-D-erythritol 2,4-cyclodiphosphate synthase [Angustibacter sp.]